MPNGEILSNSEKRMLKSPSKQSNSELFSVDNSPEKGKKKKVTISKTVNVDNPKVSPAKNIVSKSKKIPIQEEFKISVDIKDSKHEDDDPLDLQVFQTPKLKRMSQSAIDP